MPDSFSSLSHHLASAEATQASFSTFWRCWQQQWHKKLGFRQRSTHPTCTACAKFRAFRAAASCKSVKDQVISEFKKHLQSVSEDRSAWARLWQLAETTAAGSDGSRSGVHHNDANGVTAMCIDGMDQASVNASKKCQTPLPALSITLFYIASHICYHSLTMLQRTTTFTCLVHASWHVEAKFCTPKWPENCTPCTGPPYTSKAMWSQELVRSTVSPLSPSPRLQILSFLYLTLACRWSQRTSRSRTGVFPLMWQFYLTTVFARTKTTACSSMPSPSLPSSTMSHFSCVSFVQDTHTISLIKGSAQSHTSFKPLVNWSVQSTLSSKWNCTSSQREVPPALCCFVQK